MKKKSIILTGLIFYGLPLAIVAQPSGTARQVIESIIKNTASPIVEHSVDVIKEGDPNTEVKGIVTCMFATMDVLRKAVDKNCNLIIAHEPVFYNHLDETKDLQNDAVFLEKKRFIDEHHLVVWRFHDYIHRIQPDGILSGMVAKLGWQNFVVDGHLGQFNFPETTLKELLRNLKQTFPKNTFYVVGNPEMRLTHVRLAPGASGSRYHISLLENDDVEVIIAGESPQWETYEYVRDAVSQGRRKAVVFLGHIPSEEYGMNFCAEWLKKFIKDVPVYFIECDSSFWAY